MPFENNASLSTPVGYSGAHLDRVAFPLGGIGAGMLCLEGTGALSHVSLRHRPEVTHEPQVFAALHVKGAKTARVLEGPVPIWKAFGSQSGEPGNGLTGRTYGLPRFAEASFQARFPFATVSLADPTMPVEVQLIGWSPFTPGAADDSSLPMAGIEYRFVNRSAQAVEAVESVAANLAILKSPTCLRQTDGRFWGWEGCCGGTGCCSGTCTHVWNYAQALPHLFPELERTLRETEFLVSQDECGHQNFRASLPIGPADHGFHAAADGQLGGLMKLYREWRISGDTDWLRKLWPAARQSLDYCIATWDSDHTGTLVEPHHNTYDIEFWGADGMCTSFYLGALAAVIAMGRALGEDVSGYEALLDRGRQAMRTTLWNGEWFIQKVQREGLRAGNPVNNPAQINSMGYTPEAVAILQREGPKYQYGGGVLSDGVLGDWIARCAGLGPVLDEGQTAGHLASVFRHNFRESLADHANPQRPGYAFPQEAGLLLCSWPNGDKPALPFVYSDEVWTGIEYQVSAHLIMTGQVEAGLAIVRAIRQRYNGQWRNPFDEYECGHWYARAMASYGLLQALSGARYDAVEQTLHLHPAVGGDFRAFLCTATGYGTVGVRGGKPFIDVAAGTIPVKTIDYKPLGRLHHAET